MICLVIKGPSFEEARQQLPSAMEYADLVELRLDHFTALDQKALTQLRADFPIPMIFTLRSQSQGGSYPHSENSRLDIIRQLAKLKPEYLDLESHVPPEFVKEISSLHPEIKLILSYHDFKETPKDLETLVQEMKIVPAHFYKIAVTPRNASDALKLVCWTKNQSAKNLIAISMGSHGQVSRILAPVMGCPFTYATLDENLSTAPGQLSAKTLIETYRYRSLNPQTAIFGLIGDPVDKSISDVTHNHLMAQLGINAVYIKMQVPPTELPDFIPLAKQLPFSGLSVTMPLKEHILPLLDSIDSHAKDIGAVNTLVFKQSQIHGYNTDSIGALNAIEEVCSVKNKRIIILGAGGAAKAIAYEAQQRGGLVTVLNRDRQKAVDLTRQLGCNGGGLEEMHAIAQEGYNILINCTPTMPIDPQDILPQTIAMDIVTKPKETLFLKHALEKGCKVIYGYQMFIEQALGQYALWFPNQIDPKECKKILIASALKIFNSN